MDERSGQEMFRSLQTKFKAALDEFANASSTFRIVHSTGSKELTTVKTLYVLDSSFNPPSKAHTLLAKNAIIRDGSAGTARLLLLLATVNADKKPKPAVNEDRLAMMALLASDLHESMGLQAPTIDVGITDKPFFSDKAKAIDDSNVYGGAEQVHVTGFDTITRIFDSKYYPEDQKLRVLDPFLSKHRLRVTYRLDDKYGSKQDQDAYVATISDGSREDEGMRKEWREKISMVDDAEEGRGVSSTEARKACVERRYDDLEKYVGTEVSQYIQEMELYREPGADKK